MAESVRLVIWDLDETFWLGTLTEGGIKIRPGISSLVKDLAHRGILSSICSKNNFLDVKSILENEGVWEYFIFPSINWNPKGPRVAALVELVQLRPATIMFIDDNPLNLEEVRSYVPGIQVQSERYIHEIATSLLFEGKSDPELNRLNQYRLLESRKRDEAATSGDISAFLRSSDIRVEIVTEVESHIDRFIELLNRTNQLNFTKERLSEELDTARAEMLSMLRRYDLQFGLVRVSDRYGDHGLCGAYVVNSEHNRLLHFCFSCRILGMGVEQWLYQLLQRPNLYIKGEVLSDPKANERTIDWINQIDTNNTRGNEQSSLSAESLIAHGGCDLSAVAHYFGIHGVSVVPEFNVIRHGIPLRTDHSCFLRDSISGISSEQLEVAKKLQYVELDYRTKIFSSDNKKTAVLLSFATDAHYALYQHKTTGLIVPFSFGFCSVSQDQRANDLPAAEVTAMRSEVLTFLREEFDYLGLVKKNVFEETLNIILSSISNIFRIFIVLPSEFHLNKKNGQKHLDAKFAELNEVTRAVAAHYENVTLLNIRDFVHDDSEIDSILHYDRKVYFRLYEQLVYLLKEPV